MSPFASLPDLTRALIRAIANAGCQVTSVQWAVGGVQCDCPDVQSKVDLLQEIALLSATDPVIVSLGLALRRGWPDDASFAKGTLRWVQTNIRWVEEEGERFQLPRLTISKKEGDCDCSALVFCALCMATGLRCQMVGLVDDNGDGIHAAPRVDGRAIGRSEEWVFAEGSIKDAPLGRDPRDILAAGGGIPAGAP